VSFLVGIMAFPALVGLFVMFHIFRSQRLPADQSNRINKIRLLWLTLTCDEFVNTQR